MNDATLPARLREFFTLEETEREARALPEGTRATMTHELALAFQKREAAETLWPRGCSAEALALAKRSLDLASTALESFGTSGEDVPAPAWLPAARAATEGARKLLAGTKLPELESEARTADEETFRVVITAMLDVERITGLGLAPPGEIARARRGRLATAAATSVLVLLALVWWIRTPLVLHAVASGQAASAYSAENAVDGNPKTAWILPDKQTGWLDLTMGGARTVKTLRILPSNPPNNDRATREAHIEVFLGEQIVKTSDITFPEPVGPDAEWSDVAIGVKCDRVRVNVRSSYRSSASVGEVEIR